MNQPNVRPYPIIDIDARPPLSSMTVDHIGELDEASFFDRLTHAGIDIACGVLTPPPGFLETHTPDEAVDLLNRGAFSLSQRSTRYLPALCIHPACPDFSISQLQKYAQHGVRMIGVDARWLENPTILPILACAQSLNMTASLYGENIVQAEELAERFPNLNILAGGLGSIRYMPDRAFQRMQKHNNLMINLSGSIWSCNYTLHEWCDRLGPDHLLFGSGYPFSNPAGKLSAIRWELRHQPASVREQIFSRNALILTGAEGSLS